MNADKLERDCEECGEEIPAKRLEAQPRTTMCVFCQQKAERAGRFGRHQMGFHVVSKGDEVESMEPYLVRAGARC
jgi:hypothetical protein